ncbi:hypothetical protein ACVXHA_23145 [Escherichia coli]
MGVSVIWFGGVAGPSIVGHLLRWAAFDLSIINDPNRSWADYSADQEKPCWRCCR